MIEWVPIEEFEFLAFKSYLVAYKDNQGNGVGLIHHRPNSERYIYAGKKISHAAYVNFPVEKTLEEKFYELYCTRSTNPDLFKDLAQIAKEHYEGENNG